MSDAIPESFRKLTAGPALAPRFAEEEMGARLVAESLNWTAEHHLQRVRELYERAEDLDEQAEKASDAREKAGLGSVSRNAYWSATMHKRAAELLGEHGVESLALVGPLESVERLLVERTQASRKETSSDT